MYSLVMLLPLAIVLSVLLRFTNSDYPFGIFKLFWLHQVTLSIHPWFTFYISFCMNCAITKHGDFLQIWLYYYIYNTCALSKHIGNMCTRLRDGGKCEASPSLFPCFAPNTHIYLYASTVHMYCIYPAILNRK